MYMFRMYVIFVNSFCFHFDAISYAIRNPGLNQRSSGMSILSVRGAGGGCDDNKDADDGGRYW